MGKTLLAVALCLLLSGLTYLNIQRFQRPSEPSYREEVFAYSEVKSVTLVSKNHSLTLTPHMTESFLQHLKGGLKVKTAFSNGPQKAHFLLEKVLIESRDGEKYTLYPQFVMEKNIVFSLENPKDFKYFIERSEGNLASMLQEINL